MRQIVAFFTGVEGELDHLHARIARIKLKLSDLRRDIAQILGDKIEVGNGTVHGSDKVHTGALTPPSVSGSGIAGRHSPVAFKAAEMVKAHHIVQFGGRLQTTNPPDVAVFCHLLPVIERITPELSIVGEGIRRATGHLLRTQVVIQTEKCRRRPDIRGVIGDINRHIAYDADTAVIGITSEVLPLTPEFILKEALKVNGCGQFFPLSGQSVRFMPPQFLRPVFPGGASADFFDRHEQRVVIKPDAVGLNERLIRRILFESSEGFFQDRRSADKLPSEIHPARIVPPVNPLYLILCQQSLLNQNIQINQVIIPGAGRKRLVR